MKRKDQADSAAVIPNQTQLRQLNQTGNSLKSQLHNNNYVWRGGGGGKGKQHQYLSKNTPNLYFWLHVWCSHHRKDCISPKYNHNPDTLFKNMKGGNTYRWFWINPQSSLLSGISHSISNVKPHLYYSCDIIPPPSLKKPYSQCISDTGATGNYVARHHASFCQNVLPSINDPSVKAAYRNKMQATHSVHVPISPEPSATAQEVHIIDNLATGSLVFIGKIWDKYCIAIFTKYNVKIIKDGNLIILGRINLTNGLWNIPIASKISTVPTPWQHLFQSALSSQNNKANLADFLHGAAFIPIRSTFLQAIKLNRLTYWIDLTE